MTLKNLNMIVTGASRGIGREIAKTYVKKGATVTVCARSEEPLKELQNECGHLDGTLQYIVADITNTTDRKQIVDTALTEDSNIDVLVNNAGILGPRDTIAEYPDDVWDQVIDVNLNAMFHLTKQVLGTMLDHNEGKIINVTSGVGVNGYATWGAYSVSKFGVEGLTQVLADELRGTGLEVNAVNPGPISTDMRAEAYPDEDPESIPSPADIMDIFIYLASEAGRNTNGKRYEAQEFSLE